MSEFFNQFEKQQRNIVGQKCRKIIYDAITKWKNTQTEKDADKEFLSEKINEEKFLQNFFTDNGIIYEKKDILSYRLIFNHVIFEINIHRRKNGCTADFLLSFKNNNMQNQYGIFLKEAQGKYFYRGWGSFLISFIKNISTGEESLYNSIQELLIKYNEDFLNRAAKGKEIAAKTMASLCESVLKNTEYTWQLTISKGSVHKLRIQIEGNRYLIVAVKEKDFIQTISQLLEIITKLKDFEKKYKTKINLQQFVPAYKDQKLSNSLSVSY